MSNDIFTCLVVLILIGASIAVGTQAISFIYDVPKQLKRIADALEKEKKDGN